jgi:hypothetical protein
VTLSGGVAQYRPTEEIRSILSRADKQSSVSIRIRLSRVLCVASAGATTSAFMKTITAI